MHYSFSVQKPLERWNGLNTADTKMCYLPITSRYKNVINSQYKVIKFNDFV